MGGWTGARLVLLVCSAPLAAGIRTPTRWATGRGRWLLEASTGRVVLDRALAVGGGSKSPTRESRADGGEPQSFVGRPFALADAPAHFRRIRTWGFTSVRLLTTWEAIEGRAPGSYDGEYLAYYRALVDEAGRHGLGVIVDPHQDAWSRWTGGCGAPKWTLCAAGLDADALDAAGAARTQARGGPGGAPLAAGEAAAGWEANYDALGSATMFALFWGGERFAAPVRVPRAFCEARGGVARPELWADKPDLNIGTFLRGSYVQAVGALVGALAGCDNVLAVEAFGSPHPGWAGIADVGRGGRAPAGAGGGGLGGGYARDGPLARMAAADGAVLPSAFQPALRFAGLRPPAPTAPLGRLLSALESVVDFAEALGGDSGGAPRVGVPRAARGAGAASEARLALPPPSAWAEGSGGCVWRRAGIWQRLPPSAGGAAGGGAAGGGAAGGYAREALLLKPRAFALDDFQAELLAPLWAEIATVAAAALPGTLVLCAPPPPGSTHAAGARWPAGAAAARAPLAFAPAWFPPDPDFVGGALPEVFAAPVAGVAGVAGVGAAAEDATIDSYGAALRRRVSEGSGLARANSQPRGGGEAAAPAGAPVYLLATGLAMNLDDRTVVAPAGVPALAARALAALAPARTGRQESSLDSVCCALEQALVPYAWWCYTPEHSAARGDGWNGEDFSIWSLDQSASNAPPYAGGAGGAAAQLAQPDGLLLRSAADPASLLGGGRGLRAIVRPHARKVPGEPLSQSFSLRTRRYAFAFRTRSAGRAGVAEAEKAEAACAEFYVPALHYGGARFGFHDGLLGPAGAAPARESVVAPRVEVRVSDGRFEIDTADPQLLRYWPSAGREVHTVRISPAG
jgi:hypothetical protein